MLAADIGISLPGWWVVSSKGYPKRSVRAAIRATVRATTRILWGCLHEFRRGGELGAT